MVVRVVFSRGCMTTECVWFQVRGFRIMFVTCARRLADHNPWGRAEQSTIMLHSEASMEHLAILRVPNRPLGSLHWWYRLFK